MLNIIVFLTLFLVHFAQCQFGFPTFGNQQQFQQTGFQNPNQNFWPQNSNNFLNSPNAFPQNFNQQNSNQGPQTSEIPQGNNNSQPINSNQIQPTTTTKPFTNSQEFNTEEVPSRVQERISQTKCNEYSKLVRKTVQFTSLSLGSSIQDVSTKTCDSSSGLVVGGEDAKINEFPHQAAIGYPSSVETLEFKCGGSLISELYILTAAHCRKYENISPTIVRLGDLNLKEKESELPEIDIPIDQFISHSSYKRASKENDIALIKMKHAVTFSISIRPACLQLTKDIGKTRAIATGWGHTEVGGSTSDILQKVLLDIFSNEKCEPVYDDVFDSQICAGILSGGKDTCVGDSGGPLQTTIGTQCLFNIIGVTSYGSTYCGALNSPGIYTRVSSYIDWIESRVWS